MTIYLDEKTEGAIKATIPWAMIEPRIRPLVERLNRIAGIVTYESCEGHVKPKEAGIFEVQSAHVAIRVTRTRRDELLELAPACGIMDVSLRYFKEGWFWLLLAWEPGDCGPIWELTQRLLDGQKEE